MQLAFLSLVLQPAQKNLRATLYAPKKLEFIRNMFGRGNCSKQGWSSPTSIKVKIWVLNLEDLKNRTLNTSEIKQFVPFVS